MRSKITIMKAILANKQTFIILTCILLFAFVLRVFQLGQTPSGFHADEASFYLNAVSLAKTGADEDGKKFPLSLSSLIDPKPAVYSYLQIPFILTISDQVFASRMPSVVLALFSLVVIFAIVQKLSDTKIALLVTGVLSISPWHIIISRGTQEVVASFFFLVVTVYAVLLLLEAKKQRLSTTILFFVSSFLSMYFYHSAKVLVPLLVFGMLAYFYRKSKQFIKQGLLVLFLVFFATVGSLLVQESSSRISAVGILSDKAPMQQLIEQIYTLHEELPIPVVRVFYNKVQAYTSALLTEYLVYFSPDFLFLNGGKPHRYIVPDHGLLYLIELPLILIGLYFGITSKRKELPLFIGLLFLSPVPAALTTLETPSIIRSFPMVISFAYLTALGIVWILQMNFFRPNGLSCKFGKIKPTLVRNLVLALLAGTYLWQVSYFTIQYHIQAKYDQPWYRNSPYTDIAKEVASIHMEYDTVAVTNDLRPLYAYFVMQDLISIEELQNNPYARNAQEYSLGKFTFNRDVCNFTEFRPGILYIAEKECRQNNSTMQNLEVKRVISYTDGVAVYELLQVAE